MERLQKIIARTGQYSRRQVEELIRQGLVTVNGKAATLGDKADPATDTIRVKGKPLRHEAALVYLLLNKPRGYICTVTDPSGRPTVIELVKAPPRAGIYPVGRLDLNSSGLIILTNDGELTYRVSRAGRHCPKVYLVKVAGVPDEAKLARLRAGIVTDGVRYAPCEIEKTRAKPGSYTWLRVTLYQGKNRQLRKMFDAVHHPVFAIKRIAIGPLTDAGLPVGGWRTLTENEIKLLKKLPADADKSHRPPKK